MNKKNSSGAGMFMMEMIMAVFFFILCASTCIMVFVKADSMSTLARDTNRAVVMAESMAEVWKSGGPALLEQELGGRDASEYPDMSRDQALPGPGEGLRFAWNADWEPAADSEQAGAFSGSIWFEDEDGLVTARISIFREKDHKELFSMTAAQYLPEHGA